MNNLFSIDGKLFRFFQRLWDILRLDLCFVICSLPALPLLFMYLGFFAEISPFVQLLLIMTAGCAIGAATTAAYSITLKMADDTEGYIFKPYFKAYKKNFRNGAILGFFNTLILEAAYMDFQLFDKTEGNPLFFLIVGIIAAVIAFVCFFYAYPLSARYENSIINTMKNSASICTRYILRTLIAVFVIAVLVVIFMWNSTTIFIGLLVAPGTIFLTVSGIALYIFKDIERKNSEE